MTAVISALDDGVAAVRGNLRRVYDAIAAAAERAGRDRRDVKLIAVSKRQSWASVDAAARAGQVHFGENTLQDALTKVSCAGSSSLEWHFIGHLQSNKATRVAGSFGWIHSLDSLKLARKISDAAVVCGRSVNVLVQVNVARDAPKSGVLPEHLPALVDALQNAGLPSLNLCGMMTIGPRDADESGARRIFAELRRLRDGIARSHGLPNFTELSMGMSGDYVSAILEGATLVRVGTAIFGDRSAAR